MSCTYNSTEDCPWAPLPIIAKAQKCLEFPSQEARVWSTSLLLRFGSLRWNLYSTAPLQHWVEIKIIPNITLLFISSSTPLLVFPRITTIIKYLPINPCLSVYLEELNFRKDLSVPNIYIPSHKIQVSTINPFIFLRRRETICYLSIFLYILSPGCYTFLSLQSLQFLPFLL